MWPPRPLAGRLEVWSGRPRVPYSSRQPPWIGPAGLSVARGNRAGPVTVEHVGKNKRRPATRSAPRRVRPPDERRGCVARSNFKGRTWRHDGRGPPDPGVEGAGHRLAPEKLAPRRAWPSRPCPDRDGRAEGSGSGVAVSSPVRPGDSTVRTCADRGAGPAPPEIPPGGWSFCPGPTTTARGAPPATGRVRGRLPGRGCRAARANSRDAAPPSGPVPG